MTDINSFIGIFVSLLGTAFALERFYAKRQIRLGHLICKYNDYEAAPRGLSEGKSGKGRLKCSSSTREELHFSLPLPDFPRKVLRPAS